MTNTDYISYLIPGEAREEAFIAHPIVTDKAKFPTPSIKSAFDVIRNAIIQRDPGIAFTADPRFGKTYAIDVLEQFIPESFPEIPIFRSNAKQHQRPSEKALYNDILQDFGFDSTGSGSAASRRNQIVNLMISASQAMNSDRILLFVDEAQNWHENELTWVRDISNDLALSEIRLITAMFAHPELRTIRNTLLKRRTDLIGRFLVRPHVFRGVQALDQIKEIFSLVDDPDSSSYPIGSGISYSLFFLPNEFDKLGWRLANEATPCWNAFVKQMQKFGGHYEIGMRWLIAALRTWLLSHWEYEHGELPRDMDLWDKAVECSDFGASLLALHTRKEKSIQ